MTDCIGARYRHCLNHIRKETQMSKVSDTYEMIDLVKTSLLAGEYRKPELALMPILCDIAISLAEIADSLKEKQ